MHALRLRFPRIAALVLVLWLLAAGAAFAQACVSTAHLLCEECCTEAQAATPQPAQRLESAPASAAEPWVTAHALAGVLAPATPVAAALPPRPPDPPVRTPIPIAFLRLAL